MLEKLRQIVFRNAFLLLSAFIVAMITVTGIGIIKLDRDHYLSKLRQEAERGLYNATEQIQMRFFEAVLVAKGVESILLQSNGIVDAQISRLVADYQKHNPTILAVALAPGLEVTNSYLNAGSNRAIGLKYWEVPAQMASVAKAYRTRDPVVSGPVSLVQGGRGYILRYPVFLPNARSDRNDFWGVISIVIKADELFGTEAQTFGGDASYIVSLTNTPSSGGAMLTGKKLLTSNQDSVGLEFTMFGGTWVAKAIPKNGWPLYSPQSPYLFGFALLSKLALIVGLLAYRRLAKKKERAHALLSEAVDCIDGGFVLFDEEERLVVANKTYLNYHPETADKIVPGITGEEILKLNFTHENRNDDPEVREELIANRLTKFRNPGEPFLQQIHGDVWLKVTEAKTPRGYTVTVWTDVSVEKRAQKAAEEADREKTEFLNNVSHELRTPLTIIFGRATFLQKSEMLQQSKRVQEAMRSQDALSDDLKEAIAEHAQFVSEQGASIAESSRHMIRLVEDLLDWTKVSRGTLELQISTIRADEIAKMVVEELQPNAAKKGLSLFYSGDE